MSKSKFIYGIRKLSKRKYQKWIHIFDLELWIENFGQTKGQEWNWEFDFSSLKLFKKRWWYWWKFVMILKGSCWGLQLCTWIFKIWSLYEDFRSLQSHRTRNLGFLELPLGSLGGKNHYNVVFMKRSIHYTNMCPNSLCVSLDFEWTWTNLPWQKWPTL